MALEERAASRTWPSYLLVAAIVSALLAALWLVVIPRATKPVTPGTLLVPAWDLYTYFLPTYVFGNHEVVAGRLPLWNPYEFAGLPFLATVQPAALYPLKLVSFLIPDPAVALHVFLIGHFVLMAAIFLWFARAHGLGAVGALAGSIVCLFNTPLLLSNYHPVRIANLVWLPVMILLAERVCERRSPAVVGALALVVAVQMTAGYPEFTIDCGILVFVCYLAATVGHWPPARIVAGALALAAAFVVGSCAAGLQIAPLAEMAVYTRRAAHAGADAQGLEALLSRFGTFLPLGVAGTLGLAVGGLGSRRAIVPLAGLLACALVLYGGWRYLRLLPGLSFIRHPFSWMYASQFFLAWLVAVGADDVWDRERSLRHPSLPTLLVAASGLAWTAFCIARASLPTQWWHETFDALVPAILSQSLASAGTAGRLDAAVALGAIGGLLLAFAALARGRFAQGVAVTAVVVIVAGHLAAFPFGTPIVPLAPPPAPIATASVLGRERAGEGRVFSLVDPRYGRPLLDRVENASGVERTFMPPRFQEVERRLGLNLDLGRVDWKALAAAPGYLDTLDVRFVVAPRNAAGVLVSAGLLPWREAAGGFSVLSNDRVPGRAWVTYGVERAPSPEAALDALLSPDFDPRERVVLEAPPTGSYPDVARRPPTPATVTYPAPTVAEVTADLPEPGVLVLADACYPGWTVEVDGRSAELMCANYLVRGVELPAGRHVARFEYRPASLRWGLWLTGLGSIAIGILIIIGGWSRLRRTRI